MKQSYNIEVAGVQLNIVSSDGAEFVEKTVAELESSVQSVLRVGKNFSKLDAIILSALDYCAEFRKAEDKIRNLEAQIEILEARVNKDGDASSKKAPAVPAEAPAEIEESPVAEEIPAAEETPVAEESKATDDADSGDGTIGDSMRELEAFLGSQLSLGFGEE